MNRIRLIVGGGTPSRRLAMPTEYMGGLAIGTGEEAALTSVLRSRRLIRYYGPQARGGPFILCPTAGFMEWPTCNPEKVENYLTFVEAGLEYGQEPG